jgi:hypothetical protein
MMGVPGGQNRQLSCSLVSISPSDKPLALIDPLESSIVAMAIILRKVKLRLHPRRIGS